MTFEPLIRTEEPKDYKAVFELTELAFKTMPFSDGDEQFLVENLRKRVDFKPQLSIVAEFQEQIIGHILFCDIEITNPTSKYPSLSLGPVSVHPDFQRQGLGGRLVREGLKVARELGYKSVIVLGHPEYYPKFGFLPASKWNILAPIEVPSEAFMALELMPGGLQNIHGTVVYPPEFGCQA